ncbi:hypothetical protein BD309DRAFT_470519 [Dichomitus squalens]|nr:hypothetical protein BD309DRAFT_470519 [Dichomitus squalens]
MMSSCFLAFTLQSSGYSHLLSALLDTRQARFVCSESTIAHTCPCSACASLAAPSGPIASAGSTHAFQLYLKRQIALHKATYPLVTYADSSRSSPLHTDCLR